MSARSQSESRSCGTVTGTVGGTRSASVPAAPAPVEPPLERALGHAHQPSQADARQVAAAHQPPGQSPADPQPARRLLDRQQEPFGGHLRHGVMPPARLAVSASMVKRRAPSTTPSWTRRPRLPSSVVRLPLCSLSVPFLWSGVRPQRVRAGQEPTGGGDQSLVARAAPLAARLFRPGLAALLSDQPLPSPWAHALATVADLIDALVQEARFMPTAAWTLLRPHEFPAPKTQTRLANSSSSCRLAPCWSIVRRSNNSTARR